MTTSAGPRSLYQRAQECGVGAAGDIGFLAVDHEHVALDPRAGRRGRIVGFGECETAALAARQERCEMG
jgi:hypothetical protein